MFQKSSNSFKSCEVPAVHLMFPLCYCDKLIHMQPKCRYWQSMKADSHQVNSNLRIKKKTQ